MATCVVFGASKGIGAAIGNIFTRDNFNVALLSRYITESDLTAVKREGKVLQCTSELPHGMMAHFKY